MNGNKPLVITGIMASLPGIAIAASVFIWAGDLGARISIMDRVVQSLEVKVRAVEIESAARTAQMLGFSQQLDDIKVTLTRIDERLGRMERRSERDRQ